MIGRLQRRCLHHLHTDCSWPRVRACAGHPLLRYSVPNCACPGLVYSHARGTPYSGTSLYFTKTPKRKSLCPILHWCTPYKKPFKLKSIIQVDGQRLSQLSSFPRSGLLPCPACPVRCIETFFILYCIFHKQNQISMFFTIV